MILSPPRRAALGEATEGVEGQEGMGEVRSLVSRQEEAALERRDESSRGREPPPAASCAGPSRRRQLEASAGHAVSVSSAHMASRAASKRPSPGAASPAGASPAGARVRAARAAAYTPGGLPQDSSEVHK